MNSGPGGAEQVRVNVPQRTRIKAFERRAHEIVLRQCFGQLAAARVVESRQRGMCLQRREQPRHGGGTATQRVAAVHQVGGLRAGVRAVWHRGSREVEQNAMLLARG